MTHYFNLGGAGKSVTVKPEPSFDTYEKPTAINSQPLIPAERRQSVSAATSRRRTMQGQELAATQPTTAKETTQATKRFAVSYEDELDFAMPFKQPRLNIDNTQDQQQRMYVSDGFAAGGDAGARAEELMPDKMRINLQNEKIKILEERIGKMMYRFREIANARDTEDIEARYKEKEEIMMKGYADMEKYMADLRNRGIPGNIVQTELVESLKQEIQSLHHENQDLKGQLKRRENQPREANEELEVYQSLTGLIVESIGQTRDDPANNIDAGKRYTCTITSDELGTHKFDLLFPYDQTKRIVYMPLTNSRNNVKVWDALPEFLRDDIDFMKVDLPVFFWRLAHAIHVRK